MLNNSFEMNSFISPPKEFGEVAFYWWVGEPLTKERLLWQLEKLEGYHISGLQINYCHTDQGGLTFGLTYKSEPALFSDQWWELLSWFIQECKKRDISVSLSDYTLGSPGQGYYADEILRDNPDVCGQLLQCEKLIIKPGETYTVHKSDSIVSVASFNNTEITDITYEDYISPNEETVIFEITSQIKPYSIDPTNPKSGAEVIRTFFGRFEERFPNELGKGLNFFFSDELNFNISGNMWNDAMAGEFIQRKGYDVQPYLSALFEDIGDITQKIRLDYYDVIVSLEEQNYFLPVYQWHQDRDMIYGCDHGGRGTDVTEFGDYFRTQKYNQGPGNDQPLLLSEIVKNKVSSSISHLYERPRVWLEGFHSSGWGTTSSDIADAIFRNFAMGHNLLTFHGLYYTTNGGFWEWAPPCNHWRMPYWAHMKGLMLATKRLSYLNTRGYHVCDAAILYPVSAVEGGIDGKDAVTTAFSLGELLYNNAIDFDYIDFESIIRADVQKGHLNISGESYKHIIIPNMKTIRYNIIPKLLEFKKNGGTVICVGNPPIASEHKGRNDKQLDRLIEALFDSENTLNSVQDVLAYISGNDMPDFYTDQTSKPYILHRRTSDKDLYMIYGAAKNSKCFFRCTKKYAYLFDIFKGEVFLLDTIDDIGRQSIHMPKAETEVNYIVFSDQKLSDNKYESITFDNIYQIKGEWEFEAIPTLDNKFGDFSKPDFDGYIPVQIRRPYINGEKSVIGFAPYFKTTGTLDNNTDFARVEEAIINNQYPLHDYYFSMRYGEFDDPGHQGYHGLKGNITDEFIILGKREQIHPCSDYHYVKDAIGEICYFITGVHCEKPQKVNLLFGTVKPRKVILNGSEITDFTVDLEKGYNLFILKYDQPGRTFFVVEKVEKVKLDQTVPLSMTWYQNPNILPFDAYNIDEYNNLVEFICPPGTKAIKVKSDFDIVAEIGGKKADIATVNGSNIIKPQEISHYFQQVKLNIVSKNGKYLAGCIQDYIELECEKGLIELCDLSKVDPFECFSGGFKYSKTIDIQANNNSKVVIDLGNVSSSCELFVNQKSAGVKLTPPWEFDITGLVTGRESTIEVIVYNTLNNHYQTIPTRYIKNEVPSGLIGPVTVKIKDK